MKDPRTTVQLSELSDCGEIRGFRQKLKNNVRTQDLYKKHYRAALCEGL